MLTCATLDSMNLVEKFNGNRGALMERMGIEFTEVNSDRVVATMPVEGNTQALGMLHGGASAVLAEGVGSMAALLSSYPRMPVGTELSLSHHAPARDGRVVAECTPLHIGKSSGTFSISIRDDRETLICTARLTCAFITLPDGVQLNAVDEQPSR